MLAPSAEDAPDSSLSYMFSRAVEKMGTPASRFLVSADGWDPERADIVYGPGARPEPKG